MRQNKVVIVEDEGLIANDIAGQLKQSGYHVAGISASGEDALKLIGITTPDLVLMDIRLKGAMDGIDAAEQVRSTYNLPVIFLTSHADGETLARAKKAQPFGYLVKPFRQLNLCSAIEMALYKHRSERLLVEREAWLTTVLQSTADPTVVTDVNGLIQFVNAGAEQLLNRELAEVAGQHWTDALPLKHAHSGAKPDDVVRLATLQMTMLKLPWGIVLTKPDGSEIAVDGEVSPSTAKGGTGRGSIAGAVITIRDVSERTRLEKEVRHEQKMLALGRMAGGVAHDFNNLLTVILGHGSLLLEKLPAQDIQSMEAILSAAHTATGISRQLLALSHKQVWCSEVFSVNESVQRIAGMLGSTLGPKVHLHPELDENAGKVRMASANFDQTLMNLILNARDAMPEGGTVSVTTGRVERTITALSGEATETFVRIAVADTGEGISAEHQEHIFEPFFTTKAHGKGTGLGLAIVYGLLKDVGGEITVKSTLGSGTCFELLIPRSDDDVRTPVRPQADHAPMEFGAKTVLLVEDQPAVRGLIHNYLERKGFNLLEAEDGQEAIRISELYEGTIDVLVSDVLMPKMDGVTLSRLLTTARPELGVVLISAQPGHGFEALQDPGFAPTFLPKPFALPALLDKVRDLVA